MNNDTEFTRRFILLIERLRAIAQTGLAYEPDIFDEERYEELLKLAAEMAASLNPQLTVNKDLADKFSKYWLDQVQDGANGYVTTKVSIAAAVFNAQEQILLVRRKQEGWWDFPVGWCDVGYTAAETAKKEVSEETGLSVTPTGIIGVYDSIRCDFLRQVPNVNILFYCQLDSGIVRPHPAEIAEINFFSENALRNVFPGAKKGLEHAFSYHRGERTETFFEI